MLETTTTKVVAGATNTIHQHPKNRATNTTSITPAAHATIGCLKVYHRHVDINNICKKNEND
jgi:hypothetical protein